MGNSISRPAKPYQDFPLFPHATGRWAKKIAGRTVYFGPWGDPDGALARYLRERDALHLRHQPAGNGTGITLLQLAAKFRAHHAARHAAGKISPQSLADYDGTIKLLIDVFGRHREVLTLGPGDFATLLARMEESWGAVRTGNVIVRVRSVFRYGQVNGLIDRLPVFGSAFRRPSKSELRRHRQARGTRDFTADEIRRMIAAASPPLKVMITLGVNCGFGNTDLARLPLRAVDLSRGWIDYARPKTGIERRCPLWPETVAALRDWIAVRPAAKLPAHDELMFITKYGGPWVREKDDAISKETRKLLDLLKIGGGRNFYGLRHTFQTQGDESRDFIAVRSIMGHAGADIADEYRERISDERLRAVAEHVRGWLVT